MYGVSNGSLLEGDTALRANRAAVVRDCALSTGKQSILLNTTLTAYTNDYMEILYIPGITRGIWVATAGEESSQEINLSTHSADRLTHFNASIWNGNGAGYYKEVLINRNGLFEITDEDERANVGAIVDDVAKKSSVNTVMFETILENDKITMLKMV